VNKLGSESSRFHVQRFKVEARGSNHRVRGA
jgi:hypothetical protein